MWERVEREIGTVLPDDYKGFLRQYGSGVIDDFLVVLNPGSVNPNINLIVAGSMRRRALQELRARFPGSYVHDVFPAPGGLLPFAVTDNANVLYWKTIGEPNSWTVVIYEGRGPSFAEFPGGMAECLGALLGRRLRVDVLPIDFPSTRPTFKSLAAAAGPA
jgi:hypothetical protein